jgi:hypothetical protein
MRRGFRIAARALVWSIYALTLLVLVMWPLSYRFTPQAKVGPLSALVHRGGAVVLLAIGPGDVWLERTEGGFFVRHTFAQREYITVFPQYTEWWPQYFSHNGTLTHRSVLQFPMGVVGLPLLLLSGLIGWRQWKHRPKAGHCPACRYNLTGNTSGRCPECGSILASGKPVEVAAG